MPLQKFFGEHLNHENNYASDPFDNFKRQNKTVLHRRLSFQKEVNLEELHNVLFSWPQYYRDCEQ